MKNRRTFNKFRSIALITLFLSGITAVSSQTISIQQQGDYTTGTAISNPRFTVGDVNNDGWPDLVTLNKGNLSTNGPISVFLNNGAGAFAAPINIIDNTNLSPNAVVIRDFNNDGNPDLAIAADGLSTGINIRLGNGTGNFPTGTYIAERGSPAIAAADFNGDNNLDVAICNNVNELRVLAGNGSGGFAAASTFATTNTCTDLITADFNVDGRPDIAVAQRLANRIQVFLNTGASFGTPINNLIAGAYQMVTADFNRDCIPDIAATQYSGSLVFILISDGAGGFTTSNTVTVTNSPAFMTVGDFNRDKFVDLAVRRNTLTTGVPNFTILPGNGSGGFGPPFELTVATPTSSNEMRLATIDANRDGKDDVIIGRQGGFLLYNGNSALFTRTENDFDGDLRADLSVFRPSAGDWYVQRSTKGFYAQHWGISTDKPAAADYDGDGLTDLAIWRENGFGDPNRSYFWILRSSDSTVQLEQFGRVGDVPAEVGDWDGDGKADPAVYRVGTGSGGQSYFFYRPSSSPGFDFAAIPWGTTGDQSVRGDFDGDGKMDPAVFRPSDRLWYILQSSNGQPVYRSWGLASDRRVPADYDGDGKTDLAVYRESDGVWYILRSSTSSMAFYRWGTAGDMLAPADYNGDGRTDVGVYRPSDQRWYTPQCGDFKMYGVKFGTTGDTAVPSTLIP